MKRILLLTLVMGTCMFPNFNDAMATSPETLVFAYAQNDDWNDNASGNDWNDNGSDNDWNDSGSDDDWNDNGMDNNSSGSKNGKDTSFKLVLLILLPIIIVGAIVVAIVVPAINKRKERQENRERQERVERQESRERQERQERGESNPKKEKKVETIVVEDYEEDKSDAEDFEEDERDAEDFEEDERDAEDFEEDERTNERKDVPVATNRSSVAEEAKELSGLHGDSEKGDLLDKAASIGGGAIAKKSLKKALLIGGGAVAAGLLAKKIFQDKDGDGKSDLIANMKDRMGHKKDRMGHEDDDDDAQYKVLVNGEKHGPYTLSQMRNFAKTGRMNANTKVMKKGDNEWRAAANFSEFRSYIVGGGKDDDAQYKVLVNGEKHGPYTLSQMRNFAKAGRMNASTKVMKKGDNEWRAAANFSEFRSYMAGGGKDDDAQYKVLVNGEKHGPYTLSQMRDFAKAGRMNASTKVMKKGDNEWRAAANFSELKNFLK